MTARVTFDATVPAAAAYAALFHTTGWNVAYGLSETDLQAALRGSWRLVSAWCEGRLVGIGRLLSDAVQYALVVDVIVDPAWRRSGIGTAIITRLLAHAEGAGIRDVLLFAATDTEAFYARFGFRARPASAPGMILRLAPGAAAEP